MSPRVFILCASHAEAVEHVLTGELVGEVDIVSQVDYTAAGRGAGTLSSEAFADGRLRYPGQSRAQPEGRCYCCVNHWTSAGQKYANNLGKVLAYGTVYDICDANVEDLGEDEQLARASRLFTR
ncbi:hypothetical protein B0T26DRAFT_672755 [Lasiosphaeria miniovina]|uniref:Uncharacterized protein n=1 Tax=Lasiosphaeria miniovina TaxID=1954250 RepID=A0AA40B5P3_9PEZI|nr:uncharacterized protein B0T26DRAFT_672755 [Lasiosphaeria miniovina]KAK0728176.1 hypothetical protein B0T26DRAFT_672755 [Lasiosphaeria miniovina]